MHGEGWGYYSGNPNVSKQCLNHSRLALMGSGNGAGLGAGFTFPEILAHVRSHSKHCFYTCLPFIPPESFEKCRDTHNSVEGIHQKDERLYAKQEAWVHKGGVSFRSTTQPVAANRPGTQVGRKEHSTKTSHRLRPQSQCIWYTWLKWGLIFKEMVPLLYNQCCFKITPLCQTKKQNKTKPASLMPGLHFFHTLLGLHHLLTFHDFSSHSVLSPATIQHPSGPV